ncbi:MSMEG_0565 family glycosyltransferase [Mycolicibacterium mengxianglii]|uniref:MSMEG_0565 family glycosyltransferase n=1 Tax=Mycolicibacterium mengxianglii TaxID=2736649 RepID=UPI0018EEF8F1|nr:MSMEG_0565 family glycosyltransferase [Mycolicibacterium mengxianglii]
MRIALLTYSTKPRGGVVHTLALAEALARLGHDVTVWTLGRGGDTAFYRPVDPAVTVNAVPFPAIEGEPVGPRILRSITVLGAAFRRSGAAYDVVHAQDCISANAVTRCVRTVHHLDTFTTPELARCHERAITRPYAHICVSAAVAREITAGWGLRPHVIPNGVDWQRFSSADGARWRARLGRYVLAVGGIEPRKGSIDLLEAYARLGHTDSALVFAGGETLFDYRDYRAAFERRARELGVTPVMLGTVDDADMPALVAGAAVLPFFSVKEGFGLAAMEALAAGVPVVARELPVLREVFGDQVSYAADVPAMAVGLAAALNGACSHRRDSGAALARSFSWDAAAASHIEFYRKLAADPR